MPFRHLARVLALVFTCTLAFDATSNATQIIPMTLGQTVRASSAIAVVRIDRTSTEWGDASQRWMRTVCEATVEDGILPSDTVQTSRVITFTFWGGTIGDQTHRIAGVEMPLAGERYLMMFSESASGFTPVVGLTEGLFRIQQDATSGTALIFEADGRPLRPSAAQLAIDASSRSGDRSAIPASVFIDAIKANLQQLRATAPLSLPQSTENQNLPRRIGVIQQGAMPTQDFRNDARSPGERDAGAAAPATHAGSAEGAEQQGITERVRSRYSWVGQASLPIVINQLPSSFIPWAPEDQYVLSRWNYYASIFHVRVTPSPTYGWPDGVFDFAGFPSSADMQYVYGSPWASNTLGVTISRSSGGRIVEADVALNPAFSWTLNDEAVYNGSFAQSYRQTLMHEFGHVWGLKHNFDDLSTMNYFPSEYRSFTLPFGDDAEAIRSSYGGNARTDLAVYLYRADGYQDVVDADQPYSVTAGQTFQLSKFTVENAGTTTIQTPTIEWYLTSARNFVSTYVYLRSSSYNALPRFTMFTPSTISVNLTVPLATPPGQYYVAGFIRDDGGATQSSFPFDNNRSFSRFKITVLGAPPSISLHPQGLTIVSGSSALMGVLGTGSPPLSYQWYRGTSGNTTQPVAGATSNSFTTPALTSTTTYWARISNSVGFTNSNAATIRTYTAFTDNVLTTGSTAIKAAHVMELRTRINTVRARLGLTAYTFADPDLAAGVSTIRLTHVQDLREALRQAYVAALQPVPVYTDPALQSGTPVKQTHIAQIRTALIALE